MIQKEMLEYQDLDLELEKIKNTVGKSPDNVIRVRAGKQLVACKAKINEIMPKYKNLRAQLDNARKKLEAICDQVDKVGQELENVEMDEQAVYMLKKLTAQKNELAAVEKDIKDMGQQYAEAEVSLRRLGKDKAVYEQEEKVHYEKVKEFSAQFRPRIAEIKSLQEKLKAKIDPELMTAYERRAGQVKTIFVPLTDGNRCGGCRMEMPPAQVSKFQTKNFILCEHCNRIIYKKD